MAYFLLSLAVVFQFPFRYFEKGASTGVNGVAALTKYNLFRQFAGAVAGMAILIVGGGRIHFDLITLLISLMFAVMLISCVYLGTYAYRITTAAITALFAAASLIIPVIFGAVFLNDSVSFGQIMGIALFFFGVYLITSNEEKSGKKFGIKAFVVLMLFLLFSGLGSVAMQLFSNYVQDGNAAMFMELSYVFAVIILVFIYILLPGKKGNTEEQVPKKIYVFGGVAAALGYVIQQITTELALKIPASILFASVNGGSVIGAAVVGAIFYKERLTVKNTIGILIGITSLIIINVL